MDLPDLVRCRKHIAGVDGITAPSVELVDMDSSGVIDVTDLSKLRQYFATEYEFEDDGVTLLSYSSTENYYQYKDEIVEIVL
ncbi:MAG: hypothetical protein J6B98_06060 [Bacilli bacterium]|nr:hypothetical protein [Bacilli bacterium]